MEYNEEIVTESAATTPIVKEYIQTLCDEKRVKFTISAEFENVTSEDASAVLETFAKYSHHFYLYMGNKIL